MKEKLWINWKDVIERASISKPSMIIMLNSSKSLRINMVNRNVEPNEALIAAETSEIVLMSVPSVLGNTAQREIKVGAPGIVKETKIAMSRTKLLLLLAKAGSSSPLFK